MLYSSVNLCHSFLEVGRKVKYLKDKTQYDVFTITYSNKKIKFIKFHLNRNLYSLNLNYLSSVGFLE